MSEDEAECVLGSAEAEAGTTIVMVATVKGCVACHRDRRGRPVFADQAARDWPAGQLLLVLLATSCAGLVSDARRAGTEFALAAGYSDTRCTTDDCECWRPRSLPLAPRFKKVSELVEPLLRR